MYKYEVTKAADSRFVPSYAAGTDTDYSFLGKFMVAELTCVGELFMDEDEDFQPVDEARQYAVLLESYKGTYEIMGEGGFAEEFWIEYGDSFSFVASAPEGQFTEDEQRDVLAILASFRVE